MLSTVQPSAAAIFLFFPKFVVHHLLAEILNSGIVI